VFSDEATLGGRPAASAKGLADAIDDALDAGARLLVRRGG
jgi:hypothetical protein